MVTCEELDEVNLFEYLCKESFRTPLLFISGPLSSQSDRDLIITTQLSSDIVYKALLKGWSVISPHKNFFGYKPDDKMPYDRWLITTLSQIAACDCVLFLPEWQQSKGCRIEYKFAKRMGIRTHQYNEFTGEIPEPKLKGD